MAYSYKHYVGDGSTKTFTVPFPFLKKTYVKAYVNYVERTFTWATASTITLNGDAPGVDVDVMLARVTPIDQKLINFSNVSILDANNLNQSNDYNLHIVQEASERQARALVYSDQTLTYDANGKLITNIGLPVDPSDVTNKLYVDTEVAAAKTHVDAEITATMTYADTQDTAVKAYADTQDTAVKAYADTQDTAVKAYADTQDTAVKEYVDTQDAGVMEYVDTQIGLIPPCSGSSPTYTLANTSMNLTVNDSGKMYNLTNESPITITLPLAADAIGEHYYFHQEGTGGTVINGTSVQNGTVQVENSVYMDAIVNGNQIDNMITTSGTYHKVAWDEWSDLTPMEIDSVVYPHSLGMNGIDYDGTSTLPAPAITLSKNLAGFTRLRGTIGEDSVKVGTGTPQFEVKAGVTTPYTVRPISTATEIDIDLTGWTNVNSLVLTVKRNATETVYGVWGNLRLVIGDETVPNMVNETIMGYESLVLPQWSTLHIWSNGTEWLSAESQVTAQYNLNAPDKSTSWGVYVDEDGNMVFSVEEEIQGT